MLKKIKKIIKLTILWVPVLGYASNFQQPSFDKRYFECSVCVPENCATDVITAGHCAAWCGMEVYERCWNSALESMDNPQSEFRKTYKRLNEISQKKLRDILNATKQKDVRKFYEERETTNELLNELQILHREQQKERSNAVAGVVQLGS